MKSLSTFLVLFCLMAVSLKGSGQFIHTICNTFDSNLTYIHVDSSHIWEIGMPNKTFFDSSYTGVSSIVTDLDSAYPVSDTSVFYVTYKLSPTGGLPQYLGLILPFEMEFDHRFLTDSLQDHGQIHFSIDGGLTYYDALSDTFNSNWGTYGAEGNRHIFEGSGDTIRNSLNISNTSDGWVHSRITKEISSIPTTNPLTPDSILVRFTFVSDSVGGADGWQIDNLCLQMSYISSIDEQVNNAQLLLYPNPNRGSFTVENPFSKAGNLQLFNALGQSVYGAPVEARSTQQFSINLPSGIYSARMEQAGQVRITKVVIGE